MCFYKKLPYKKLTTRLVKNLKRFCVIIAVALETS